MQTSVLNFNRTKIVATIGPSCSDKETLKEMIFKGIDVCRINFSHGTHEQHKAVIDLIRELNDELNTNIAILADLQGPKIRIGDLIENTNEHGEKEAFVNLVVGENIIVSTEKTIGTTEKLYVSYDSLAKDVAIGDPIMMDDGKIQLKVVEKINDQEILCEIIYGGKLLPKKGVNLPDTNLSTPALTPKDEKDLEFIIQNKVDWIALSFVRQADELIDLRYKIKAKLPNEEDQIRIIAKIEKPQAIENLDSIVDKSDGIMVARGDLGVEVPIEKLPMLQKTIIKKCKEANKPVIVATQLMESMRTAFMPTRAEAIDVANGVMDGADALMLSAETATGDHPIKVIESMEKIISSIEEEESLYHRRIKKDKSKPLFYNDSMCYLAVNMSQYVEADGIIAMTQSGYTAQKIASFRPNAPIFVFTKNKKLMTQINLYWGIRAFYYDKYKSTDETIQEVKDILKEKGMIEIGDVIINTASMPIEDRLRTNMIKLTIVD